MSYLQTTIDLARARGYLDFPEVLALQESLPGWFLALGTESGVAAFEERHKLQIPAALREYYNFLPGMQARLDQA